MQRPAAEVNAQTMDTVLNEKKPPRRATAIKLGGAAVAVTSLFAISRFVDIPGALQAALDWIEGLGVLGALVYIALYILATVFLLPGSILTLGAGAIYGPLIGTLVVSIASTLGATAAFLVGRYFARGWIGKKIEGNAKFRAIDKAVAEEGWKIVGLIRLVPVIPFNLLNYALSLTRVSLRDYVLASWICMLPATAMYVYIGWAAAEVATLGAEEDTAGSPARLILYAVGFVATIAVTVVITRIAKRALQERLDLESDTKTGPSES